MENLKLALLQQIRKIHPYLNQFNIPIENEHQFNALMKAFDEVDVRWTNQEKASSGISYHWEGTREPKIKQIIFEMHMTHSGPNRDKRTTFIIYYSHKNRHHSKYAISFEQFMHLPAIAQLNVHYKQTQYNQPQLPIL